MSTNIVRNNPAVMGAIQKNILEHISLMAQEQIQLEFRDELMRLQAQQTAQWTQELHKSYKLLHNVLSLENLCCCRNDRRIYEGREENYITI